MRVEAIDDGHTAAFGGRLQLCAHEQGWTGRAHEGHVAEVNHQAGVTVAFRSETPLRLARRPQVHVPVDCEPQAAVVVDRRGQPEGLASCHACIAWTLVPRYSSQSEPA